jgi:alkylation response protein AidB-like acyl-CoA dehydrogenase
MNFDFPEDLKLLRDQAARFLADNCAPSVNRAVHENGAAHDATLWGQMAEQGWMGVTIPEAYGGSELGHLAACLLAEEIGRHIAPVPYGSTVYLATEAILMFGSDAQKARYLPGIAAGETIATFAAPERPGAFSPERMTTSIGGGKLSGEKLNVSDGAIAQIAVVAGKPTDGSGAWLAVVELDGAGVTRTPQKAMDASRSLTRLSLADAPCDPLVGATDASSVQRVIESAAVMMAFEQVGAAQASLDLAKDFALERYAFGRPIGSFQAIKHKLVDMYVAVELARSNAYYGAWALSTDASELPTAAAVARISAGDAGWLTAKESVQTLGGQGFTWGNDCHLYFKRSNHLRVALGGPSEWKRRLARGLKNRNTALSSAA